MLEPACAPTATVTVAVVVALRTAVATPFASVETATCSSVPAVVENVTGAELSGLPLMSITVPAIVERPPVAGSSVGFAETRTLPTAAVPTATLAAFAPLALAPPELAVMIAVPFAVPALNLTVTRPPLVRASDGSIDPNVVVKITTVPSCGGVPAASTTWAMMSVVPFTDSAVLPAVSVIVDPVGASNGTFWQAPIVNERPARTAVASQRRRGRDTMKAVSILVPMKLAGQAQSQHGYAMAVLLVAMSIMAIMLTVVMPVWKHTAQREKEEELVFRGMQYVHAIALFQRKTANAYPPNIDLLVRERYLRKKYKDPITNDDFVPLPVGLPPVPGRRAATASRADAADKQPQTGGDRLRLRRLAVTRRARRKAWVGVGPRRRSERRAPAPSEASAASPARARTNLFASTTAVLTTTSGRSSTFSSNRRPARVRPLGERVPAAAAPRLPARAASAGEAVHPIVADQQVPGVKTAPGPAALAPSRADSLEERPLSSR